MNPNMRFEEEEPVLTTPRRMPLLCGAVQRCLSLAALYAVVVLPIGGCFKPEDYKDPEAFVEKYIRADFEKKCPPRLWRKFQYADVVFENVTSRMRETFCGPMNEIICEVRIVPEKGKSHYKRADVDWGFAYGLDSLWSDVESYLTPERVKRLNQAIQKLETKRPLLARKLSLNPIIRRATATDTVSCFRTRDENGIFVPLTVGERVFDYQGVFWYFDDKYVFGERMLKAYNGYDIDTLAGRNAYIAFSNRCMAVKAAVAEMNSIAKEMRGVTNNVSWGRTSYVRARYAELLKAQVEPIKAELAKEESAFNRRTELRNRTIRDLRRKGGNLDYDKKRLTETQARRAKDRERMVSNLAQKQSASMQEQKPFRLKQIERDIANLSMQIDGLDKKQRSDDARFAEVVAQKEANQREIDKVMAEAVRDKDETSAKTSALKQQIETRTGEIKAQVLAEADKKLKDLGLRLQAYADTLAKLL